MDLLAGVFLGSCEGGPGCRMEGRTPFFEHISLMNYICD